MSDDPVCNRCGHPRSKHGVDQYTLEPTKCPAYREEKTGPRQEPNQSPGGDY